MTRAYWRAASGLLRQPSFDGRDYGWIVRRNLWLKPCDGFAIRRHHEFFKIPADITFIASAVGQRGKFFVNRVTARTIDFNFFHHGKRNAVGCRAKFRNFLGRARLLAAELIAWESDDGEAFFAILILQGFERGVLRGQAAFRCNVDDEQRFAIKSSKRSWYAGEVFEWSRKHGNFLGGSGC